MKAKIAVATVSGRAYYLLVNELKQKGIDFLSLTPHETIPLDIDVVITTLKEQSLIQHPRTLVYKEGTDPTTIVNEATRIIGGKKHYETIVVGIDPGKTFGLAVLSDGNILETGTCSSISETIRTIINVLEKLRSTNSVIRVGSGAPSVTTELLSLLNKTLPDDTAIEIVDEAGTSRFVSQNVHKRGLRDAFSAVKIAERRGHPYQRRKGEVKP
jgi:hypothetical protein